MLKGMHRDGVGLGREVRGGGGDASAYERSRLYSIRSAAVDGRKILLGFSSCSHSDSVLYHLSSLFPSGAGNSLSQSMETLFVSHGQNETIFTEKTYRFELPLTFSHPPRWNLLRFLLRDFETCRCINVNNGNAAYTKLCVH
jgi:hypothetical protein